MKKDSEAIALIAILATPAVVGLWALTQTDIGREVSAKPHVRDAWKKVISPFKDAVAVTATEVCDVLQRRRTIPPDFPT